MKYFFIAPLLCICMHLMGQPLIKKWDYRYGGTGDEWLFSLLKTNDGGFVMGGFSYSDNTGDKSQTAWGERDYWMVKTDSMGLKQWDKRFGGSNADIFHCMALTSDGGYILGGMSKSPVSGDKSDPVQGNFDYWAVKTDGFGNKLWDKRFGGISSDDLTSICATSDGGYLFAGRSLSGAGADKSQPGWGSGDFWIVKTDDAGIIQWEKTFGGLQTEYLCDAHQTPDGGYIIGGTSDSGVGGEVTQPSKGFDDYWLLRIDAMGNKLWDKRFGGNGSDVLWSMEITADGGFILGGTSFSGATGDKSQANWGWNDYWLVKTDSSGNLQWNKVLGGTELEDEFGNVFQTLDGGYLVTGNSYSDDGNKTEANLGFEQTWVVKLDANGNELWDKTIFTMAHDETGYAVQADEYCYVTANHTASIPGGYKTQPNWDTANFYYDFWISKYCELQSPLPVEWLDFSAEEQIHGVLVRWSTASESNNAWYELERKEGNVAFSLINRQVASGNSSSEKNYFFEDSGVNRGHTYYYRLRQIDVNGTATYSKVIGIKIKGAEDNLSIWYDPQSGFPQVVLFLNSDARVQMELMGLTGQAMGIFFSGQMKQGRMMVSPATELAGINPGIYLVKITIGEMVLVRKLVFPGQKN